MKTITFKPVYSLFLGLFLLVGCSSMNNLTMSVTEPAPVNVPSQVERIGILNRSESTTNKTLEQIDQVFSIEGKKLDQEGAQRVVQGIKDEFDRLEQFEKVVFVESDKVENPGLGIFPSNIPWDIVEQLCKENSVDALFVLSFYDTDAAVSYNTQTVEKVNAFGIKIPIIEHTATVTTNIKAGFRVYNNLTKEILDEIVNEEWTTSVGRGINPAKALEAISGRKENVLQISNNMGHNYALRTHPFRIRVTREYYVRGTDNFEIAKRRAQTGNWDGAAELWEIETRNPKSKIAGRACYNMAIINEINGDLDAATSWASKAYTDYEDGNALRYLKILNNRIAKKEILEYQSN